jgi:hypothetical protein
MRRNALIPELAPPVSAVPVSITIGGVTSQAAANYRASPRMEECDTR